MIAAAIPFLMKMLGGEGASGLAGAMGANGASGVAIDPMQVASANNKIVDGGDVRQKTLQNNLGFGQPQTNQGTMPANMAVPNNNLIKIGKAAGNLVKMFMGGGMV